MFQTKKQLDRGSIASGVGLLAYLACLQFQAPMVASYGVLVLALGIALWTEASILCYPAEKREADINYNNLWGQSAMTLLLLGCAAVVVRQLLGL